MARSKNTDGSVLDTTDVSPEEAVAAAEALVSNHDASTSSSNETITPVGEELSGAAAEGATTETEAEAVNTITAYRFAKLANEVVVAAGLKELPPQMFYSYAKKGLIGKKDKPMTEAFAKTWAEEYIVRKQGREAAAQAKLEAELNGEDTSTPTPNEPDVSTEGE